MSVDHDNIIYSLNIEDKTASVVGYKQDSNIDNIIIPNSITYESVEYTVTILSENSFSQSSIVSIQFAKGSQLRIIEKKAFFKSSIESITIPSKVTEIQDEAFMYCFKLKRVEIESDSKLQIIGREAFSF